MKNLKKWSDSHISNETKKSKCKKTSKQARSSYIDLVNEAVGEDISNFESLVSSGETDAESDARIKVKENCVRNVGISGKTQNVSPSITINVNYVFGASGSNDNYIINNTASQSWTKSINESYVVDSNSKLNSITLPCDTSLNNITNTRDLNIPPNRSPKTKTKKKFINPSLQRLFTFKKSSQKRFKSCIGVSRWVQKASIKQRNRRNLQKRWDKLIKSYRSQFTIQELRYSRVPIVLEYYRSFRALAVYSDLLLDLKMFCRSANNSTNRVGISNTTTGSVPINSNKRSRSLIQSDEENCSTVRSKRANRQEESYRNMLLPDTAEEANRKDAIFAYNFFEKVEEILKASNRYDDCKKFNQILKTFDPRRERASILYNKLEKLFLPHHPELAEVFLTFLLPAEAAEIGKFFDHFMINNMTTFVNKLNTYFSKQPAQIRKIYNCLNELAEDSNVTVNKVEERILPLLKGNPFLIDWFLQQFPRGRPPQRILPVPEYLNLKEVQTNHYGQTMETFVDTFDSPRQEQPTSCQIKYINGRIFFGSKLILPAKLSFMAANYNHNANSAVEAHNTSGCAHAIQSVGSVSPKENISDINDKSDEDIPKGLVIDSSGEEGSCIEVCDESTLRVHAMRLNSNYYNNFCLPSFASTPNASNSFQPHHANAKKTSLFNETSPRKNSIVHTNNHDQTISSPIAVISSPQSREKRKSPTKKSVKCPINTGKGRSNLVAPMVTVHDNAKKSKLFENSDNEGGTNSNIIARTKNSIQNQTRQLDTTTSNTTSKRQVEEKYNGTNVLPSASIKTEFEISENETLVQKRKRVCSEEDNKLDIVVSLVVSEDESDGNGNKNDKILRKVDTSPWTRDEDKIILTEMKIGSNDKEDLFNRIEFKLSNRTRLQIVSRYEFLMDFLTKLQGK